MLTLNDPFDTFSDNWAIPGTYFTDSGVLKFLHPGNGPFTVDCQRCFRLPASRSYAVQVKRLVQVAAGAIAAIACGKCGSPQVSLDGLDDHNKYIWRIGFAQGDIAIVPAVNDVLRIEVEDVSSGEGTYDVRFKINGNLEHEETSVILTGNPHPRNSLRLSAGRAIIFPDPAGYAAFDDLLVEEI